MKAPKTSYDILKYVRQNVTEPIVRCLDLFTGKLSKQVAAGGFYNMRMANVVNKMGGPMLSRYEEANAFNTSGAHNKFPKWGRRPKATGPTWAGATGGRPHYVIP